MEELLSERRFDIISDVDKSFIVAFNRAIHELGYDCNGSVTAGYDCKYMIIYGKTGTNSRPCATHFYMTESGSVILRFYLNKVDSHRQYIENAPVHIKDAFIFEGGDCQSCNSACAPGKVYTIDGQLIQKCNHSTFYFNKPTLEKLPDYMNLLSKFYPKKKG